MQYRAGGHRLRSELQASRSHANHTLAVISFIGSALTYLESANILRLMDELIIISVIPFMLIAIMPTNKKRLSPNLDTAEGSTRELLSQWGKRHAVRTLLGTLALLIFITLVIFD